MKEKGFKGFTNNSKDEYTLYVSKNGVENLIKEYKKIKKFQKSNMYEISKLSGIDTQIEKLIDEYGIDDEALKD